MKHLPLLLLTAVFIFHSCEKDDTKNDTKITIQEAEELIIEWVFNDYNPDMIPSFTFDSIIDLTNDDIYTHLEGQVFYAQSNVPGLMDRWLFIKDRIVYDLHGSQYANEPDTLNLTVTDLNSDSQYELFYTSHSGSGVVRAIVNCFMITGDSSIKISLDISTSEVNCQFQLQKEGYQKLYLKYVDDIYNRNIGEISLEEPNGETHIVVQLFEDIPGEIADKLLF